MTRHHRICKPNHLSSATGDAGFAAITASARPWLHVRAQFDRTGAAALSDNVTHSQIGSGAYDIHTPRVLSGPNVRLFRQARYGLIPTAASIPAGGKKSEQPWRT